MTGGAAPKRKGSQFEREVVTALRAFGVTAERAYGAGKSVDTGDIEVPGWCIEAKACQRLELAAWLDETERERAAAGVPNGALVVKRRGKSAVSAYVVMSLEQFARTVKGA